MGNLCCSEREGKLTYSIDANNPLIGKVRLKIDRQFLEENGFDEIPSKLKLVLPKCEGDSPDIKKKKIRLGHGRQSSAGQHIYIPIV